MQIAANELIDCQQNHDVLVRVPDLALKRVVGVVAQFISKIHLCRTTDRT